MVIGRIVQIGSDVTTHFMVRYSEWIFGVVFVAMGVQLLRPEETFASPIYRVLGHVATEDHWGSLIFTIGAVRVIALLLNGTFRPFRVISPIVRSLSAFATGATWAFLGIGFLLASPIGTSFLAYGGLMALEGMICIAVMGEIGVAVGRVDRAA